MDKDVVIFFIPLVVLSAISYVVFRETGWLFFGFLWILLLVLAGFMLFFFRDPFRETPEDDRLVVAPADGRVVKVKQSDSVGSSVSIFLSPLDVHINRTPVSGKVVDIRKKNGLYLPAYKIAAESKNKAIETDIETPYGIVTVRQVVGVLARRLVNRLEIGDEVVLGQRIGLMRFGSRIDVYLPENVKLEASLSAKVRAGSDVIGRFVDG
ncbi:MAG: phosphatidylserine decarboxylase family protein [candidate division Zixibacteria bacterium]|nr:phosphatidylserine decarboxylase family protein [candidate division Zixibacteria bacterium]